MQPLKMTIDGSYWDSYLYLGRLFLFEMDGSIRTVDWDRLIESLDLDPSIHLAITCAFLRSNFLYGNDMRPIFEDVEIKDMILDKFVRASKSKFHISGSELELVTKSHQENKFPFPHADATFYNKSLYVGSKNGVFGAGCAGKTKNEISSRVVKTTDIPARSLSASYYSLALASGDDGLHQLPLSSYIYPQSHSSKSSCLSERNCDNCQWTFYSIYGSSHVDSAVLAAFTKQRREDEDGIQEYHREFDRLVQDDEIFGSSGYSWGAQDKLYQEVSGLLRVVKYSPWNIRKNLSPFELIGEIQLKQWKGTVISGGSALFGTVIECENAVVVLLSNGESKTIPGEPVNWRVFPRSHNYENQLHIIYDDRIEVFSFNHDYLIDQATKRAGTSFYPKRARY